MVKNLYIPAELLKRTKATVSLLNPWFWGRNDKFNKEKFSDPSKYPYNSIWRKWNNVAPELYKISTRLADSDVVIIPKPLEQFDSVDTSILRDVEFEALKGGVRVIGFWSGDAGLLDISNNSPVLEVYAQATNRSKKTDRIKVLPAWASDLTEKYYQGEFEPSPQYEKPCVCFCGNSFGAGSSLIEKGVSVIKENLRTKVLGKGRRERHPRAKAIESCLFNRKLQSDFILKDTGWRGFTFSGEPTAEELENDQKAFVDNMFSSIYALCVRGAGNFSYRLYEVLSAGRIPVIINTDTVLPLDDYIDWRAVGVWVDDPEKTGQIIYEHWKSRSKEDLMLIQRNVFKLWNERIRPEKYFQQILG